MTAACRCGKGSRDHRYRHGRAGRARAPAHQVLSARSAGRIVKGSYPNASEFRAFEVEVDGIASLATVLDEVAADGHAAVIRGAPGRFYPRNGSPAFRLLQPQEGLASARTGARISQQQIRTRKLSPTASTATR